MQPENLPLLPTVLVGSYATPSWLVSALAQIEAGAFGEADVQETYEDAVRIALQDQERAGLDILTDGEMRRHHFIMNFFRRLEGVRRLPPLRKLGSVAYDVMARYAAEGRLRAQGGLGIAEEFSFLRSWTDKPVKICCPGPLTLSRPLVELGPYRDRVELVADLAAIVNGELKRVAAAGADYIQVDEPRYSHHDGDLGELVSLFNRTVEGVHSRVALHICFGNYFARSLDRRTYRRLFPYLLEARAQEFVLEFANREGKELDLAQEVAAAGRTLGLGVIDVKSCFVETADEVAERIRAALAFIPAEQLRINPDCGFNHTARWLAFGKMCALVEGARRVRQELAG